MASEPRDQVTDHLLAPENAPLLVIQKHTGTPERLVQAGAQPISWVSLACELQQDVARGDTAADVVGFVLAIRLPASV